MAVEIVIPQVGEAVAEVRLVEWLKQEGDQVQKGDPLFEIDTDKAVVVVEAYADGTLEKILIPAGSAVMPRQVVGLLAPANEQAARLGTADGRPDDAPSIARPSPVAPQTPSSQRVLASPRARGMARELGVDLTGVRGTGVGGLITVKDVQSLHKGVGAAVPRPLSKQRQTIATRMASSKQTAPHFYLTVDVDMSQAMSLRGYCRDELGWDRPPGYTDIIVWACALAVAALPEVNVTFSDSGLIPLEAVNIGVAVGTEGVEPIDAGLIVPVLQGADRLGLRETAQQIEGLVERARLGRLRDSELGQKSMVVTNLGMYGIDAFIAIIDPPDPMILAVGRIADRVVPIDGAPAIRPVCTLCLSADHRVMDGILGARFLNQVKIHLENPYQLLGQT